jgi:hypothetical protein
MLATRAATAVALLSLSLQPLAGRSSTGSGQASLPAALMATKTRLESTGR